jgi:hypothetical protein
VALTFTLASTLVGATIAVDAGAADALAASLSSSGGILSSAQALTTTLADAGLSVSVESAPTVTTDAGAPVSTDDTPLVVAMIAGSAAGLAVAGVAGVAVVRHAKARRSTVPRPPSEPRVPA